VWVTTVAAAWLIYKYPSLEQRLIRIKYLQSKGISQPSEELVEAEQIEHWYDEFWMRCKIALLLNGLIFLHHSLTMIGIV
jgi:hypothetical protein